MTGSFQWVFRVQTFFVAWPFSSCRAISIISSWWFIPSHSAGSNHFWWLLMIIVPTWRLNYHFRLSLGQSNFLWFILILNIQFYSRLLFTKNTLFLNVTSCLLIRWERVSFAILFALHVWTTTLRYFGGFLKEGVFIYC